MTMQEITEYLDDKIAKNQNEIIITFYEIRVKMNLSEEDTEYLLKIYTTRLQNLGYKVYLTGEKFVYAEANRTVQSNQLMIAIKEL
ncbi:MAG: hypothetical protein J6B98_06805 [Bacilli bacterium]|nr:hypothetical protein [Bacilli bacterium]